MTYGPCGSDPLVCLSTSTPLTLLVKVIGGPETKRVLEMSADEPDTALSVVKKKRTR